MKNQQSSLVHVAGPSEKALLGPFEALYVEGRLIAAIPLGFALRSGEFGGSGAPLLWSNQSLREKVAQLTPPKGSHIFRTRGVPIILPPIRYLIRHELGMEVRYDPSSCHLEVSQGRCVVRFRLDPNSTFQFESANPPGIQDTSTLEAIRSGFEQALYPDGAL